MARLTADIDEDVHRKLRTAAAARGVSVREYLESVLNAAFDADPYVEALEFAHMREIERIETVRARIQSRMLAAENIEDPEIRERILSRSRVALADPLEDLTQSVARFSAMSALSVRRETEAAAAEAIPGG